MLIYLVNFLADNRLAVVPETSIVEGIISGKECFVGKVATSILYWEKVNNFILSWFVYTAFAIKVMRVH